MRENKRMILHNLLHVLWKTRAGKDVIDLDLQPDERIVRIVFHREGVRTETQLVDVDCDSGLSMVIDICRALL